MAELSFTPLPARGVFRVAGDDAREFLQGLISNDVNAVAPDRAIYAALLTPQGKFLFDFFVAQSGDDLLIECERARMADLMKRLTMYKLRAQVTLSDESEAWQVVAHWGDGAADTLGLPAVAGAAAEADEGVKFVDPRLAEAGTRSIIPAGADMESASGTAADADAYDAHRLGLGLPDGSRDLIVEKSVLLESGFDELNGVDWNKGCYMGQELTARTKYRGLVKKRLVPVDLDGPLPEPGTEVTVDGKNAGEIRSGAGATALALLRLEHLDADLDAAGTGVRPRKPDWAAF